MSSGYFLAHFEAQEQEPVTAYFEVSTMDTVTVPFSATEETITFVFRSEEY